MLYFAALVDKLEAINLMNHDHLSDEQAVDSRLRARLAALYGEETGALAFAELQTLLAPYRQSQPRTFGLTERDVILITYGDQLHHPGESPLATLHRCLPPLIGGVINTLHLLPFYPYSSDDGFSVIDYYAVNPDLGDWADIRALRQPFRLMFDAVFNHISAQSEWFQAFLRGESPYDSYFIVVDPSVDLSLVRRPRALPLLTPFETPAGVRHVWTTFSADQVDLNFANPAVLLDLIRVLLFYLEQGADLIRLDAIAYLWKIIGTESIHLEQTHEVIKLLRDVLDAVAPAVVLITETNVPHDENISYFGDGSDEAQMVYQFSLPPLLLHTFRTGDATVLTRWAANLQSPGDQTTYFNFTASHDGIGVQPARGYLSQSEIDALVALAEAHGGYVSYKNNADGSRSPYELNITYFDAITHPDVTEQDPATACARFTCSQAIMLALRGVPGIYFHSLFGSRNHRAGVEASGRYRSINREKFAAERLLSELEQRESIRQRVFSAYRQLLSIRRGESAFHPLASQQMLEIHPAVLALARLSPDNTEQVIALHNIGGETAIISPVVDAGSRWRDLLTGEEFHAAPALHISLAAYQVAWLKRVHS